MSWIIGYEKELHEKIEFWRSSFKLLIINWINKTNSEKLIPINENKTNS
jgi:hypothetical protein